MTGDRDMVLLTNGSWIDATARVNPLQVAARYDADKHVVSGKQETETVRWGWLDAVQGERNMSDWFSSLRVTRDAGLSNRSALMLYAHQTGWVPSIEEPVLIVTRMGMEIELTGSGDLKQKSSLELIAAQVASIDTIH